MNWHIEAIAAKLAQMPDGRIRRLIVNLPPHHSKSLSALVAFQAWCLGHKPSAKIFCVSYAQDLADKLARDCRRIVARDWYRRLFPTRLSPRHQPSVAALRLQRAGQYLARRLSAVERAQGPALDLPALVGTDELPAIGRNAMHVKAARRAMIGDIE